MINIKDIVRFEKEITAVIRILKDFEKKANYYILKAYDNQGEYCGGGTVWK